MKNEEQEQKVIEIKVEIMTETTKVRGREQE
jgi:hypothetical protein